MTDRSDSEMPADQPPTEEKPEERELRGRYVEGTYGKAGVQRGRRAEDEEGQYIQGDYGAAGSEGGLPEPLGDRAKESGRYVAADYGDAGAAPGRTAGSEIGQYTEGDYGAGRYCGSPAQGQNRCAKRRADDRESGRRSKAASRTGTPRRVPTPMIPQRRRCGRGDRDRGAGHQGAGGSLASGTGQDRRGAGGAGVQRPRHDRGAADRGRLRKDNRGRTAWTFTCRSRLRRSPVRCWGPGVGPPRGGRAAGRRQALRYRHEGGMNRQEAIPSFRAATFRLFPQSQPKPWMERCWLSIPWKSPGPAGPGLASAPVSARCRQ